MKLIKLITFASIFPLSFCAPKEQPKQKGELVIPTVDVQNLQITLPELPTYNEGSIKTDGTYDYIDLYEVSDVHGAVEYKESSSGAYIGLQKMATYFNNKRSSNEGGTVLLSSGDMFQGSADSNSTRGYMVNYAMHYMGFEAMAVGNHEFDWTDTWLKNNANLKYGTNEIPYLGINIIDKSTSKMADFLKKSTIIERGGYKIGVIGAIGSDLEQTIMYSCIDNYDFVDELNLVNQEAQSLRDSGCDIVVLLEHQGGTKIPAVNGVDAIFGGHAHENYTGSNGNTPVAATKNYGRGIAHISFKINKLTKAVSLNGVAEVDEMTNEKCESIANNADIKSIMDQYAPAINSIKNIELATTPVDLKHNELLQNICTQSMFDKAVEIANATPEIDSSKILASFHNVEGGIRDDINAGTITYGNVFSSFPFDNSLVFIKARGQLLINKLSNFSTLGTCRTFKTRNDINANEDYYIVTTDFVALSTTFLNSTSYFRTLTEQDLIQTGLNVRDIVAQKIYELDKINPDDFAVTLNKFKGILPTF